MDIEIPQSAQIILDLLEAAGHEAYVVGGCVRDALMGREPADWDITTSAKPEQIKAVAAEAGLKTVDTGIAHGTVTVIIDHKPFEVTTYRADGEYSDGRHPDSIEFLDRIDGDLARRDFTVNAMAYNPTRGLVDRFGGQSDLQAGILRAVGDPHERFTEDALRIVRGLRFAAQLGFSIEERTSQAMHELRNLLDDIAVERIWIEFAGLLCGKDAVPVLREYSDVVFAIIPELADEYEFDQHNPFHRYDVWEHTLHALQAAPPDMDATQRLAILLHDVGKPYCLTFDEDGKGHMYGHEKLGEPIARDVCHHLRLSRADTQTVTHLVRHHMFSIPDTEKAMRRFLVKHGPERAQQLFAIRRCDKSGIGRGQMVESPMSVAFAKAEKLMEEQLHAEPVFGVKDLAVSGRDLIDAGMSQGPEIGRVLEVLLDAVVEGEVPNEREVLLARAQQLMPR
ncbi:MAG: HD domain-containing protein [Coriobacteriales bacterium]